MKKIAFLFLAGILCLLNSISFAQTPEKFNYQAVIRDASGELVTNQDVGIKVSILDETSSGTVLYSEEHAVSTNAYGQVAIEIGGGTLDYGDFSSIDWGINDKFLKLEVDIEGGTSYVPIGTSQLLSVPYALYANSANNLGDENVYSPATDTLFVVKDHDGNVVFAVFPDGAAVYVNEGAKGKVGGFAVSGRSPSKAGEEVEYMRVTTDSTRIYVNEPTEGKGKVGGFAVSGRSPSKGITNDYLVVTGDSTRIYVNDTSTVKGKVGGFAVSGRSPSKGVTNSYLQVTRDSTRIYVKDNPAKGANGGFAVGSYNDQSKTSSGNFLDITPLNSFIGLDAGKSNTTGERNAFIGYQAGYTNTSGYDNVFIGNESGLENESGVSNIFLGTGSGKGNTFGNWNIFVGSKSGESNTTGSQNITIGEQSGFSLETGRKNIFIGVVAGYSNVDGLDNVFIGNYAGHASTGSSNVYIGRMAGVYNTSGIGNVFIGEQSGWNNVEGSGNVFIGKGAGANELESNKLYISNSDTETPLIYGEFDNGLVDINGSVKLTDILNLKPKTSFPGSPAEGDVLYDANSHSIKYFNGTIWMELSATASVSTPLVTTDSIPAISILGTSCAIHGNISDQGGSAIVESGFCFNEIPFYDIANATKVDQSSPGLGYFGDTITGLGQNNDYYIRSFASNSEGTSLGNMMNFTTPFSSANPTVTTGPALSITQTTATGGGDVSLPGGKELTALGICWSTTPEPTIANDSTSESIVLGTFVSDLSGLTANTTYYVRAYATNSNGTAYGNEVIFNTASDITTVSDIDGNVYNTVHIGTQTWMKENLKTTKYSDGSDIPNITDNTEWMSQTSGAFCWYDNDSTTYNETYGTMYNYYAVVDSRNLCPTGWHVPADTDWTDLSDYLGGEDIAGGKLKETGTMHWVSPNTGADNSSGFTALPGGYRYDEYGFLEIGYRGQWWSSTEYDETYVWTRYLKYSSLKIGGQANVKSCGYSVRCLKDE